MPAKMSNEELATLIKSGRNELYGDLWKQTKRFFRGKVNEDLRRRGALFARAGLTADDMLQICFFVLVDAVQAYDPEKGLKLLSYTSFHIKNRFNAALRRKEPLNNSSSIDDPLPVDGEDEGKTFADTIEDETALLAFDQANDDMVNRELQGVFSRSELTLTDDERIMGKMYFIDGKQKNEICAALGLDSKEYTYRLHTLYRRIRDPKNSGVLRALLFFDHIETMAYHGTGLRKFRHTGRSSVERVVEELE